MAEYLEVKNLKTNRIYRITSFKRYQVEQSLTIPADYFSFTMGNYESEISNAISAGDEISFFIDDKLILLGNIDDIEVVYENANNDININGRDKTSLLLDNDAVPATFYKLNLKQYLDKKLPNYNIKKYTVSDNYVFDKIVISPGESEWGVIEKLINERGLYSRFEIDTLKIEKLRSDTRVNYVFSNDLGWGIKIKKMSINLSSDVKNEVQVYSSQYAREEKKASNIKGSARDNNLKIRKRMIIDDSDLENKSQADKKAREELNRVNRNAFVIEIETKTNQRILVGHIARIKVDKLNLDCLMLIDKVRYTKDEQNGSITTVTFKLIEGYKVNWNNHNIPVLPRV